MPVRLFLSSGDPVADRRFEFARDLQLKGDLVAAADLLEQAVELAPNFPSAWFLLGEIREKIGQRDRAIAAFRRAVEHRCTGSARRLPASDAAWRRAIGGDAAGLCTGAVRSICAAIRGRAGRRSRLSRPGTAVPGGAVGARRRPQARVLQMRDRPRLRHRIGGRCVCQGSRSIYRHRPVAAHDRAGPRHRPLRGTGGRRDGGGPAWPA